MKESDESEASVTPSSRVMPYMRRSRRIASFWIRNWWRSTMAPGRNWVSPGSATCTCIIWDRIVSMCLSSIVTDWLR